MGLITTEKIWSVCPRANCDWYRMVSDSKRWQEIMIEHPLYGRVTNRQAASLDVANHHCDPHAAAQGRMRARLIERGEKIRDYRKIPNAPQR